MIGAYPARRSADAAPACGRDPAQALSKRSCARRAGRRAHGMVGSRQAGGGALLVADRGSPGIEFRRPVRELSRRARRRRISHQLARLLGGAVDDHRAALDGAARAKSRRHRDGGAGAAARRRARLGRRLERNRRRPDAHFRHLGTGLGDRARRSGAGPRRAHPPWFRALERRRPQASPRSLPARRRNGRAERCRKRW